LILNYKSGKRIITAANWDPADFLFTACRLLVSQQAAPGTAGPRDYIN
jgi:hypothetical protein